MTTTINASTSAGLVQTADTSGILQLQTANTAALTITASQNVGIGTASPATKLHVKATNSNQLTLDNAGEQYTSLFLANNGTTKANLYYDNTNSIYNLWATAASSQLTFGTVSTERMRIDSSGNVGINGTPAAKLQVFDANGNFGGSAANSAVYIGSSLTGNNATTLGFGTGSGSTFDISLFAAGASPANAVFLNNRNNAPMAFLTNNTERMRINAVGYVGVGTSAPGTVFHAAGTASSANLGVAYVQSSTTGDTTTTGLSISKFDNNATTSQIFVKFGVNNYGTGCGQINGNGANSAAFGSFSDSRLKENIIDLPSQLSNVLALRPVEFDYIESEGGGHQTGFIAQEMQKIYPDAVGERTDGMLTVTGWDKTTARLVKAIQEQQALITQLQADVAALKGAK